jgi:hypothetical protein
MRHITRILTVGILIGIASRAEAQQPANGLPPESAWKGRSHVVLTLAGEEISGRMLALGPDEVRMLVKGQERTWRLDDIVQVDRKGDSLKNGAIIGALVLGGWCAYICGQGVDSSTSLPGVVIINAGFGALIGMGIDAGNQVRKTVYQKSSPPQNRQARLFVYRISF